MPKCFVRISKMSASRNGLRMKSSQPSSNIFMRSSSKTLAVRVIEIISIKQTGVGTQRLTDKTRQNRFNFSTFQRNFVFQVSVSTAGRQIDIMSSYAKDF